MEGQAREQFAGLTLLAQLGALTSSLFLGLPYYVIGCLLKCGELTIVVSCVDLRVVVVADSSQCIVWFTSGASSLLVVSRVVKDDEQAWLPQLIPAPILGFAVAGLALARMTFEVAPSDFSP